MDNKIMAVLFSTRFRSFYWRSGMMLLAAFLTLVSENITGFGLSPEATVMFGLVLGEISKAISNAVKEHEPLTAETVLAVTPKTKIMKKKKKNKK